MNGFERDQTVDRFGTYETVWECKAPADNVMYYVLEDDWNSDYTVRIIRRIEIA
jgi:hypothetical protein